LNRFTGSILLLALAGLGGCASAPQGASAPAPDLSHYRAAVIGEVHIAPAAVEGMSDEERTALEREFYETLVPVLSGAFTSEHDAGVLRVDITINELDGSTAALNAVSTLLIHVPVDRGSIAFEARFYEPARAEPVAQVEHRQKGHLYEIAGGLREYGHAKNALRDWAKDLKREIEGV